MPNGFNFTFNLSPVIGAVSALSSLIRSVFIFLFNLILVAFDTLAGGINATHAFSVGMFGRVGDFFRHLWEKVIKGGLLKLAMLYHRLKEWLDKHFGPLLKLIRVWRARLDFWFNHYIRPIINLINRVRKILVVFRIFHFKWAEALDNRLLRLEGKILKVYTDLRAKMNEVATAINILLDPALLIRGSILGRSIAAAIDEIFEAVTGHTLSSFIDVGIGGTGEAADLTRYSEMRSQVIEAGTLHTGPLADYARAALQDFADLTA